MAPRLEAVIGLEIHAQLLTRTKIFCRCEVSFGAPPNTLVCPVCLGLPGALPVLNTVAVDLAVRTALALGCHVHPVSAFARKNYFYPDLPKGYQISQYDRPLATGGSLAADMAGPAYPVGIVRVHLEEDAGKSLHESLTPDDRSSYVDFNRSGVPLVELVTCPDLRSAADAAALFRRLRELMVAIEVSDGSMERGSLRCDANVSLRRAGDPSLGVKTEIKNLNSFAFLQKALEYEVERQSETLAAGGRIAAETRLWDARSGRTLATRTKEEAHDYRYFPEPDLPPLVIDDARVARIRAEIGELPDERRRRLVNDHGLSPADAVLFTQTYPGLDAYFVDAVASCGHPTAAANWIRSEVVRTMRVTGAETVADFARRVPPAWLAGLIRLVDLGRISGPTAKTVFERMHDEGRGAEEIVAADRLGRVDDEEVLATLVAEVMRAHPVAVAQFRQGQTRVFGFLVGQVIKASGGRANPSRVNDLVRRALGEDR